MNGLNVVVNGYFRWVKSLNVEVDDNYLDWRRLDGLNVEVGGYFGWRGGMMV